MQHANVEIGMFWKHGAKRQKFCVFCYWTPLPLWKIELLLEIEQGTPCAEIERGTPFAEIERGTPSAEIEQGTPSAEIEGGTP